MSISTHILDTNLGKPAAGVTVQLYQCNAQQPPQLLAQAVTDNDGRIKNFAVADLAAGQYQLIFEIADYFQKKNCKTFFPQVCLQFYINNPQEHYHVPLLISPFAYSTYRGS